MRARHTSAVLVLAAGVVAALALGGCTDSAYWVQSGGSGTTGQDAQAGTGGTPRATGPAGPSGSADPDATTPADGTPGARPTPPSLAADPEAALLPCDPSTPSSVPVADSDDLTRALADAAPGDTIVLTGTVYDGTFTATARGASDAPIVLCAPDDAAGAVLDGGGTDSGYTLHLDGAAHWVLQGFAVRGGQKGVMLDGTSDSVLRGLTVSGTGDEGVHFRAGSSDNLLIASVVERTGLREERFGEGVYIGTAESNWCEISGCEPDRSDRNRVVGTSISATGAESIDVKEGTAGGELRDNTLDGSGMAGADSLIDLKGSGWSVTGNTGTGAPLDGAQVHVIVEGWGADNVFAGNVFGLAGSSGSSGSSGDGGGGFAVKLSGDARRKGNVVSCDNEAMVDGAADDSAISNVDCTS